MAKLEDTKNRSRTGQGRKGSPKKKEPSAAELLGPNSEIGRKLKQYHDQLLSLEVPERFEELLKRLEDVEKKGTTSAQTVSAGQERTED